jgi:hypothetical protein
MCTGPDHRIAVNCGYGPAITEHQHDVDIPEPEEVLPLADERSS